MVTVDSTRTSMLPTPSTNRSRASTQSPGAIRTRPHQMNAGGLVLKNCVPRIGDPEPFKDMQKPAAVDATAKPSGSSSERLIALRSVPRNRRREIGISPWCQRCRLNCARRDLAHFQRDANGLNRTLLNDATPTAMPMIATMAHETSQNTDASAGRRASFAARSLKSRARRRP